MRGSMSCAVFPLCATALRGHLHCNCIGRGGGLELNTIMRERQCPGSECICRGGGPELQSILRGSVQNLRDAMAAGVLALTCVDHRLAALRTAVIAIER